MNTQKEQPKHGKDEHSGKSGQQSKSNPGTMAPGKSGQQQTEKETRSPQNPDKDKNRGNNNW